MRSHISVHRATTKYFSNSFIFKNKIEKEGLPRDSPAALGAGGPRFESGRPDHHKRQTSDSQRAARIAKFLRRGFPQPFLGACGMRSGEVHFAIAKKARPAIASPLAAWSK
jgi:hypothetical protein